MRCPGPWQRQASAILVALLLLAWDSSVPAHASGALNVKGRWTTLSRQYWNTGATHLILLRGRSDSTRVLFFTENNDAPPHLWLWDPVLDSNSAVVVVPDEAPNRLFCAGHATLKDGRLLVAGGTDEGETGTGQINVFDATSYGQANHWGWSHQDTMFYGRWYPSVTLLGNAQSLITSGQSFTNMVSYGGRFGDGTRTDLMRRMEITKFPKWDQDPTISRPAPRDGHVMGIGVATGKIVVYGGRGTADTTLSDVWQLDRIDKDDGEHWLWTQRVPQADANTGTKPSGRARAASVTIGDSIAIFGGLKVTSATDSTVLGDVWRLNLTPDSLRWEKIPTDTSSGWPGPRFGAVASYDPGNGLITNPSRSFSCSVAAR